jgi:hypothetical protein
MSQGFAGFVQTYIKPSRWWRRHKTVQLTIWPRFIAQALCPHIHKNPVMWSNDLKKVTLQCIDCHKRVEEAIDCNHSEVTWASWENIKGVDIPHSYRCELCGCPLWNKDLPKNVKITPHSSVSAARDH